MYKDRFHVRVAVVGGRGCIACCRERQRHRGARVNVFQLFLNAAFNGGGSTVVGSGGNNNGPEPTKQWWSKKKNGQKGSKINWCKIIHGSNNNHGQQ